MTQNWQPPPRPLSGVRVLDFSHVIAGPFTTWQLAQLGAEVIKVERPGAGDVMRNAGNGAHAFTALNAGKHLTEIDIGTAQGREQALALAGTVDVMLDNYRPGVLSRHGLGAAQVRARHPALIYCTVSGYGHGAPDLAGRGAYDHVMQALTGMTLLSGNEGDPPVKVGFPVIDAATGLIGALAVLAALRERDRTGQGCVLDVSMWASALQLMYPFACDVLTTGQEIARVGNRGFSGSPASDTFACSDGWLAIGANTHAMVTTLMQVLDIAPEVYEPMLEPPTDARARFARAQDPVAFRELLSRRLSQKSAADLEQRLNDAGVPAARVRTLREFGQEAVSAGMLQPLMLGQGDTRAVSPGLGWRVSR